MEPTKERLDFWEIERLNDVVNQLRKNIVTLCERLESVETETQTPLLKQLKEVLEDSINTKKRLIDAQAENEKMKAAIKTVMEWELSRYNVLDAKYNNAITEIQTHFKESLPNL